MSEIYFSRRLSSWGSHSVFLFTVGLSMFSLLGWFGGSPIAMLTLLLLLVFYAYIGTARWHSLLHQRSPHAIQQYFVMQFGLITLLLIFELSIGVTGLSTSILGFGLMFQAAVLPARVRLWLLAGLVVVVVFFYGQSIGPWSIQQTALYLAMFTPIYGVGLFLGLLVVREEQAREMSIRLDESNRKLAQYALEIETLSTLRERNRLAREIHDNLGHYLTAINMQIEVALLNAPTNAALLKMQTLTKEALSEIRRSISSLRATPLENHLLHEAIAVLIEEHRVVGHHVTFDVDGTPRHCSSVVEMTLYRIAQEGLTNIRKHARSESAEVVLNYREADSVTLEIRDKGVGSDNPDTGFGLLGIRERVQLLGGTLTIETAKGQGFRLCTTLPVTLVMENHDLSAMLPD